jgi:hypothetical protein
MNNTTVGVDESLNSVKSTIENHPKLTTIETDEHYPGFDEACKILGQTVAPKLRFLRASILCIIDASMPNKEQNRAVKNIIRKLFNESYTEIVSDSIPGLHTHGLDLDRKVFTSEKFDVEAQENS